MPFLLLSNAYTWISWLAEAAAPSKFATSIRASWSRPGRASRLPLAERACCRARCQSVAWRRSCSWCGAPFRSHSGSADSAWGILRIAQWATPAAGAVGMECVWGLMTASSCWVRRVPSGNVLTGVRRRLGLPQADPNAFARLPVHEHIHSSEAGQALQIRQGLVRAPPQCTLEVLRWTPEHPYTCEHDLSLLACHSSSLDHRRLPARAGHEPVPQHELLDLARL